MPLPQRNEDWSAQLTLATKDIKPEALAAELAKYAKASLREGIQEGWASDRYDRYVNGFYNRREEDVDPPGPILYDFHWWKEIIEGTIEALVNRSPVRSGRYRDSFRVLVGNQFVANWDQLPIGATILIVNTQPYARKIEVGHMKMSVPDGVVEDAMIKARQRFGNICEMRHTMINIPNNYILRGVFRRGYKPGARKKLRQDTQAGTMVTYPAIKITMR